MEISLVAEGLKFMLLGMSVVFIFLALLVQIMKLQAFLVKKYFTPSATSTPVYTPSTDDESARIAAVMAAVTAYRQEHPPHEHSKG